MSRRAAALLGPVGVWLGAPLAAAPTLEARQLVAAIEARGYGALWVGESPGYREAFTHAGLLLSASRHLVVATGIANLRIRDPLATAAAAATLAEAHPDRFVLGLGTSHPAALLGRSEQGDKPLAVMRGYLDALDAVPAPAPPPARPVPRVLAALRPRMQQLAAERADGVHTFCVPPEHTAAARDTVGPDALVVPQQAVVLDPDPTRGRAAARAFVATRLALPNYVRSFRALGFTEDDVAGDGSDRLVDALVAHGDVDAVVARVRAHHDAGADHVAVHPLGDDPALLAATLRELAPALLSAAGRPRA